MWRPKSNLSGSERGQMLSYLLCLITVLFWGYGFFDERCLQWRKTKFILSVCSHCCCISSVLSETRGGTPTVSPYKGKYNQSQSGGSCESTHFSCRSDLKWVSVRIGFFTAGFARPACVPACVCALSPGRKRWWHVGVTGCFIVQAPFTSLPARQTKFYGGGAVGSKCWNG